MRKMLSLSIAHTHGAGTFKRILGIKDRETPHVLQSVSINELPTIKKVNNT
jgi:hypothetical protein